jgi:hypothetical protein
MLLEHTTFPLAVHLPKAWQAACPQNPVVLFRIINPNIAFASRKKEKIGKPAGTFRPGGKLYGLLNHR